MDSHLLKLAYPAPPSLFLNALSVINLIVFANGAVSELRGKNAPYSKFSNRGLKKPGSAQDEPKADVHGRTGMLVCYVPSCFASLGLLLLFPSGSVRISLLKSALALHFFKRVVEVLFVHKYSGTMSVGTSIAISVSYLSNTLSIVYAQHHSQWLEEPPTDLKHFGLSLFLVGIVGNLYHHCLLSQVRKESDKRYKIPKGGLFGLVICPHYLFEILVFVGLCCISQTLHSFSIAIATTLYLVGRSFATRKWYISKFEDFPQTLHALIPYVF